MKKLLIATTLATLASSALANEGTFYLRGDIGLSISPAHKLKATDKTEDGESTVTPLKVKAGNGFLGSLGAGYYVMDNLRAELALSGVFGTSQTRKKDETEKSENGDDTRTIAKTTVKPIIKSLHLKGLYDFYDFGSGALFAGAGVGISNVSAKYKNSSTESRNNEQVGKTREVTCKWKSKNNFSYLLTVGSSFNVADNIKMDVAYTYADHGMLKKIKETDEAKMKYRLATHALTTGVRFAL